MIKITLQIDGMACSMCESHVNDAIRRAFSVKKVSSSHKKGTTEILTENPIPESAIRDALGQTGYRVTNCSAMPYVKKSIWPFSR